MSNNIEGKVVVITGASIASSHRPIISSTLFLAFLSLSVMRQLTSISWFLASFGDDGKLRALRQEAEGF